jgi:putative phage-type endonuclease
MEMLVSKDRSLATYTHEEWLAWRRRGVGGSDAPVIMGLSPYRGWLGLYVEKLDRGLDPQEPHESAYWGQQLEEMVAREFEKRSGLRVSEPPSLVQHPDLPWMIGTPDRFVHDPRTGELIGILEVKTAAARRSDEWEEAPAEYARCQLMHYLAVTGLPRGWIAVLLGGQRYLHYELERDDAYIADLIERERAFWRHIETDTPPDPDGRDSTTAIINTRFSRALAGSSVELSGDALSAALQLRELSRAVATADDEVDRLKNVVRLALAENEVGTVGGEPVVSWMPVARTTVDLKRLRRDHPDLVREYERQSATRTFRVHHQRRSGEVRLDEDDD